MRNNITDAWAFDREFVHIVGPRGSLWPSWATLGIPWGRFWADFCFPLFILGHPWGPCGPPWAPGGYLGGSPIEKQPRFGDLASAFVCKITTRSTLLALKTGATGETEVVLKTVARTPLPTHAGGKDDVKLKQTPSNEIKVAAFYPRFYFSLH